jgi:invasion protein IalB
MSTTDQTRKQVRTPVRLAVRSAAHSAALATGIGFAILTGAAAQEATTTPPATPAPAPAEATVPGDLSMGQEVSTGVPPIASPETATVGQTYLASSFEVWEQRCVKTEDGADPCQLYQLLRDEAGGPVAEMSIFDLPADSKAAAGATVMVPLETLLTANLQISIDKGKAKVYPFTFCTQIGCLSRIGFTAAEVDQFRKGAGAVMTIVPAVAPDQRVDLNISLKGFTAGFKAVTDANADVKAP